MKLLDKIFKNRHSKNETASLAEAVKSPPTRDSIPPYISPENKAEFERLLATDLGQGTTPFELVVLAGPPSLLEDFLKQGFSATSPEGIFQRYTKDGTLESETPAFRYLTYGHTDAAEIRAKMEVFTKYGADPNPTNEYGSALLKTLTHSNFIMTAHLLEAGYTLSPKDIEMAAASFQAARNQDETITSAQVFENMKKDIEKEVLHWGPEFKYKKEVLFKCVEQAVLRANEIIPTLQEKIQKSQSINDTSVSLKPQI